MKKILIVFFMVCFISVHLFYIEYEVNKRLDFIEIPVFNVDLDENQLIKVDMLTMIKVPKGYEKGVIYDYKKIINKKTRIKVKREQLIYENMLKAWDDSESKDLKIGEFLYSAPFKMDLKNGDTIDIIMKSVNSNGIFVECIVSNARLVDVDKALFAVSEKDLYYLKRAELYASLEGVVSFKTSSLEKDDCDVMKSRIEIDKKSR